MRAILLANATAANFGGLRLRRPTIQGDPRPPRRTCWMTAVAPTTNTLRKASSPALVMTPSLTLPAVEWSFGVKPIQAANCRPDRNISGAGGRHRGLDDVEAVLTPPFGELDNQDRVLGGKADEHHEADLRIVRRSEPWKS